MPRARNTALAVAFAAIAITPALAQRPPGEPSTAPVEPSGESGAPLPVNRPFADLDAYLAYLRKRAPMDGAWYREVRPGVYQLETGNLRLPGGQTKRTFTRAELQKKFGFVR